MKGMMRNLILFLVIGGLLAGGFYYFFNKNTPEEANISSSVNTLNPNPSNTNTSSTNQTAPTASISGITLDTSIFSNPAFLSLRDSSVILIPRGNEGRPNPFAPIGVDNTSNTLNSFNNPNSSDANTDDSLGSASKALDNLEGNTTN